ncbi:LEAF RUST 10 DISEASE-RESISTANCEUS RECEPTOR-LIKE PROTEIN KINASE-like 2.2 [Triticum aestivum]|uniref:LEAF RUST 10 DISEASE-RESISTANCEUS RECEPTOR-LIKE PROTEIN KINASE-like 2.2 n=1 Tax=Triticum aestivum TaxID=4565 RepID=UPI001D013955|nr:LEAF RUST 10 DISEASE-RESISTANCE LOCUS RECEPTOR-LIKE PROTEIN KINASE-like 2.2 [Triticum aestivum]
MSLASLLLLLCVSFFLIAATKPGVQAEGCSPERCGNLTIATPFGLVSGSEENTCMQLGFQVHCTDGVPYLGYHSGYGLQILNIFPDNGSMVVSDILKLGDFNSSSHQGCHVPMADAATKIGPPFSISPLNQNLIFYNCTKPPPARARLVETMCGNNTFVRAGGWYNATGGMNSRYALEGCNATAVPVLVPSGEANAGDYEELISDGLLLTWQPLPSAGGSAIKPGAQAQEACLPERCGNLTISSPFGLVSVLEENRCAQLGFQVHCTNSTPYLWYYEPGFGLQILNMFYSNGSLLVADIHKLGDFESSGCHVPVTNTSSKIGHPFSISNLNQNIIFYNCTKAPPLETVRRAGLAETVCRNNTFVRTGGHYSERDGGYALEGCNAIFLPVLAASGEANASDYEGLISNGFLLTWRQPPAGSGIKRISKRILILIVSSAVSALLFLCVCVMMRHPKGKRLWSRSKRTSSGTERNYEAMILSYGSLAPKRYTYSQVMKITSSSNHELGKGGYGVVFKGRLHDDRLVAVKFLHDCKGNGDDFVNEVMSIGRTSHVNIVSLFGFCLEGSKRALIYEYMPNGSLDRYIYSENPKEILGWERLYAIAIGIARGLEYLHHSCNTRIVHFDIKPQNILLDKDFCPKIADFGLAKLCHAKESKLSMTGARGTIGFIAPEVHSRTFGVVSTKSDVYSYGMMLLEMVGGRKNVKSVAEKSSEEYFPDWIYDHLCQDDGLRACEVRSEIEEIAKKMTFIGLWCIQVVPMYHPTITKVLEMFERSLDELDMPPKQNFHGPLDDSAHNMSVQSASYTISEDKILVNSKNIQLLPAL